MIKTLIWTTGILGSLFILFLLTAPEAKQAAIDGAPTSSTSAPVSRQAIDSKPVLYIGQEDASVTLVEYGDFKCPSCNSFHHGVGAQLRDEYVADGRLNIEFRNLPFIGPDSGQAARGAYCANDQQVFADYHDKVYNYIWDTEYESGNIKAEYDNVFTVDKLVEIMTGNIGDISKFKECAESTEFDEFVNVDLDLARIDGVNGTPGFKIAGQKITGPQGYTTFKTLIDIELNR